MGKRKVLIVHYRIGGNDGVSLEIKKREKIFEYLNLKTILLAGPLSKNVDYIIEELEFDLPEINKIKKNCFEKLKDFGNCESLINKINEVARKIYKKIEKIYNIEHFDFIVAHNIFSHGRHISAAKAFFDFLTEYRIPTIAFNHDFYWDRDIYKNPTCLPIKKYLKKYVPPVNELIKHVVINNFNKKRLKELKNIDSEILPDLFYYPEIENKFNMEGNKKIEIIKKLKKVINNINSNLDKKVNLNKDLVFLHATRIVERKAIEIAIDFVDYFNSNNYFNKLKEKSKILYNNKILEKDSQIVLIISGYAEYDSLDYLKLLKSYAKTKNLKIIFIGDFLKNNQNDKIGNYKINNNYVNTNLNNSNYNEQRYNNDYNEKRHDNYNNHHNDNNSYKNNYNKNNSVKLTLWELYSIADVVTYTSINEGFGNQFLEAVWAKKPIVVFEYPVFKSDIKQKNFVYISLGDKASKKNDLSFNHFWEIPKSNLEKGAELLTKFLLKKNTKELLKKNFNIAYNNYSIETQSIIYKKLLNLL